jgi:hypothetical protein
MAENNFIWDPDKIAVTYKIKYRINIHIEIYMPSRTKSRHRDSSNHKSPRGRHWYRILKDFMAQSKGDWARRYPDFRSHNDGDKLVAYKLVEKYVNCPKRYKYLPSVWALTTDTLKGIEMDSFVIKAVFGNQGRRVVCLHRKLIHGKLMYKDILRHNSYSMNTAQALSYVIHMLKKHEGSKGSALFIEEFVGNPERGLPQDYKFYTVEGKVRLISVFGRRGKDEYANSYLLCDKIRKDNSYPLCAGENANNSKSDWIPVKMSDMYRYPEELDYIEKAEPLDPLPDAAMRKKLVETAEKLASHHKALFCRYDFYCENNKIYFGEITPVCGDLNNYSVLDSFAKLLCPSSALSSDPYPRVRGSSLSFSSSSSSSSSSLSSSSSSPLTEIIKETPTIGWGASRCTLGTRKPVCKKKKKVRKLTQNK